MKIFLTLSLSLLFAAPVAAQEDQKDHAGATGPDVPAFTVRPRYRVTLAVPPGVLEHARFMEFGNDGTLYVSQKGPGKIAALRDEDGDGVYEAATTFLEDQSGVHGMQYRDGWLWFATPSTVGKARDTDGDFEADDVQMVLEELAGEGGHSWRPLLLTDTHFFTGVGDPGNATDQRGTDREKIWRYSLDGSKRTLWSSGIRNTEELQFRPGTDDLYGVDHGSDWFGRPIGDDGEEQPITNLNPPDEFNLYVQDGFYGHPFITADHLPRYEFLDDPEIDIVELASQTIPPAWNFGAHWAGNGWTFLSLDNAAFPADHRADAFIAFHGSWNRRPKAGYRIQRVLFDPMTGNPYGSQMLVGTLGEGGRVLARPVDVIEAPDGSLLFTSDHPEQVVYRLEWVGDE